MRKTTTFALITGIAVSLIAPTLTLAQSDSTTPDASSVQSGYADVNGLHMYYEIHGTGEPLVVLHGAYMAIPVMSDMIARLAETRQVIAVEMQGHGRTADIDRPITYEALADDVAALLNEIGVEQADVFGYSLGGGVALQIAIRHPEMVRKLVVASATFNSGGMQPGLVELIETITPEFFAGTPVVEEYERLAPNPEDFPALVEKLVELDTTVQDWSPDSIQSITAPTLIIAGDADSVTLEHTVDMFRLRGGGVNGDITGLPNAQLAVLPATTHIGVIFRTDWVVSMMTEFLATPMPA